MPELLQGVTITPRKSVSVTPQKWVRITLITLLFERAIDLYNIHHSKILEKYRKSQENFGKIAKKSRKFKKKLSEILEKKRKSRFKGGERVRHLPL